VISVSKSLDESVIIDAIVIPMFLLGLSIGLILLSIGLYQTDMFTKLQVADRAQAIIRAREAGLGKGEP
jgi:hypothetical protein